MAIAIELVKKEGEEEFFDSIGKSLQEKKQLSISKMTKISIVILVIFLIWGSSCLY